MAKLSTDQAVRLLRAKAGELETIVLVADNVEGGPDPRDAMNLTFALAADIALVAQLLADHMESNGRHRD